MSDQVPYREPGTRPAERMGGRGGMIVGAIILVAGAGLIGLAWGMNWGELKTYPLVIGFGTVCLGLSLMLNGAIDWMRGK